MQLHLQRKEEKYGMFKKKTQILIEVNVTMEDKERDAITKLGLDEATIVEPYVFDRRPQGLDVGHLLWCIKKGEAGRLYCGNYTQADELEEAVKEKLGGLGQMVRKHLEEGGGDKEEVIDL